MFLPMFSSFVDLADALLMADAVLTTVDGGAIITVSQPEERRPLLAWLRIIAERSGLRMQTDEVEADGTISFSSINPQDMQDASYKWGNGTPAMDYSDNLLTVWLCASLSHGLRKDGWLALTGPVLHSSGNQVAGNALLSIGATGYRYVPGGSIIVPPESIDALKAWLANRVSKEVWAPIEAKQQRSRNRNAFANVK